MTDHRAEVLKVWLETNECSLDWSITPRAAKGVTTIEQWRTSDGISFIVLLTNGGAAWEILTAYPSNDVAPSLRDAEQRLKLSDDTEPLQERLVIIRAAVTAAERSLRVVDTQLAHVVFDLRQKS